jgi:predicted transcriptional regulator
MMTLVTTKELPMSLAQIERTMLINNVMKSNNMTQTEAKDWVDNLVDSQVSYLVAEMHNADE